MRFSWIAGILCVFVMGGTAFGHEFLLKPSATQAEKGEKIDVQAQAAHVFMISEEAEKPSDVRLELIQAGKTVAVPVTAPEGKPYVQGTVMLPESGPALLAGTRLPQIWSDTTEGVLEGNRAALTAQGKKVLAVGRYEKFAKTLLNASPDDVDAYNRVLGQPLEIVLLHNPARMKAGQKAVARFKVLLNGKPLPEAEVGAAYDGYSQKPDEYVSRVTTDANGEAGIPLDRPGLWMLRASYTGPVQDAEADKVNLRATYAFAVN